MGNYILGRIGPIAVIVLGFLPLLFWWPYSDFSTTNQILRSIGQATGIIGFSFYALNIILSSRNRIIDILFVGINRAYIFHHLLGVFALLLLLVHPLSLALSYLSISVRLAADLLIPNLGDLPVLFGIIALWSTILLLVLTLFVKLEYNFWKSTHRYLGGAMFFAGLHVLLISSTVSQSLILKIYLLSIAVISLGLFLYHHLFSRQFSGKKPYYLKSLSQTSAHVVELVMAPALSRPVLFKPGQFIFMEPIAPGVRRQSHPFSLTNAKGNSDLSIGVKIVGDFTATLKLLNPHDQILVEGPYGAFTPDLSSHTNQVWIAGGIGITPFVSMARSLSPVIKSKIDLYYLVKDLSDAVFISELQTISRRIKNFHLIVHESDKKGRLTGDIISQDLPDLKNREIYICGPTVMMTGLKEQLKKIQIPSSHVHTEEFSLN